jgi:hypothetical protein
VVVVADMIGLHVADANGLAGDTALYVEHGFIFVGIMLARLLRIL